MTDCVCSKPVNCLPELTTASSENQQDESKSETTLLPDWTLLPDVVLTCIFGCLSDTDRHSMALVCSRWSRIFSRPCLWRYRYFRFGGLRSNRTEAQRAIGFARKHGHALRYLTVICEHPSFTLCKRFQKTVTDFFGALTWKSCKLRHLVMSQLYIDRYWRYDFTRERLVASLARFLKKQTALELFDMSEAMFGVNNGFKVLDALAAGSGRCVRVLNIEDFFHSRLAIFRNSRFHQVINRFKDISSFYLNYNCMSEELVRNMATTCAGKLLHISIKVYKHDPHYHVIDNFTWRHIRNTCPNLRVSMYFESIGKYEDISRVLSRDIPLRCLQIWSGVHHQNDTWRLSDTLNYIGEHFCYTLEDASLSLENGRESIDDALIAMLLRCKCLEYFDLQMALMVPSMAEIYRLQQTFKIGLLKCHISAENLTGLEIMELENVNALYQDMINERCVDFRFVANELPFL